MKRGKIKIKIINYAHKKDSKYEILEKEIDAWIVNRNFAVHKSIDSKMWTVTLLVLGTMAREFYTKKEAVFFAEWANGLRVPTPWEKITMENPGENIKFLHEKSLEYISKWIDKEKEDENKKARKLGRN